MNCILLYFINCILLYVINCILWSTFTSRHGPASPGPPYRWFHRHRRRDRRRPGSRRCRRPCQLQLRVHNRRASVVSIKTSQMTSDAIWLTDSQEIGSTNVCLQSSNFFTFERFGELNLFVFLDVLIQNVILINVSKADWRNVMSTFHLSKCKQNGLKKTNRHLGFHLHQNLGPNEKNENSLIVMKSLLDDLAVYFNKIFFLVLRTYMDILWWQVNLMFFMQFKKIFFLMLLALIFSSFSSPGRKRPEAEGHKRKAKPSESSLKYNIPRANSKSSNLCMGRFSRTGNCGTF